VLLLADGNRDGMHLAVEDPAAALPLRRGASGRDRSPSREVIPMFFEKLTAWTLVVVYYTITCGAIVLGLKGAL
jgi:hypothetical protein